MAISWVVFASVFGGALLGMGLIATMAALVLALLIATAESSHDMQSSKVTEMSADFILLDRILAHYGAQTKEARDLILITIASVPIGTWVGNAYRSEPLDRAISPRAESFYDQIQQLQPSNDFQRALLAEAMQISLES